MNKRDKKYYSVQITKRFITAMDKIIGTRDKKGKITTKSFGEVVGISSSNLNRLRSSTGENVVTVEAVGRLCNHYKVSPHWLIAGQGDPLSNGVMESIETRVKKLEETVKALKAVRSKNGVT